MRNEAFVNLMHRGAETPARTATALRAGPLQLVYADGALRYIRRGDEELLRMIYIAVRDRNWDTVQPTLHIVNQHIGNRDFEIRVAATFRKGGIVFDATYHIVGTPDGKIGFHFVGAAGRPFLKNRIGFCILHPIKGCKGIACEITEPTGNGYVADFPVDISPHQPFMQVQRMHWRTVSGTGVDLEMEGDVFETEDQRNWTDASYKTYCTPLGLPFPARVAKGQEVRQSVYFSTGNTCDAIGVGFGDPTVSLAESSVLPMIRLGVDLGDIPHLRNDVARKRIGALKLDHLRIAIDLRDSDRYAILEAALRECVTLHTRLFVALFAGDSVDAGFLDWVSAHTGRIGYVLLLTAGHKATLEETGRTWLPHLRERLPDALLGVGTDAYFAELNRMRPNAAGFDFVGFSINPQVHACDDASLVETLEAQREVVQSAQRLYPGKCVFVSPLTLKPRFNPNATAAGPPLPDQLPEQLDSRQGSFFAAGWTVGSIAALAETGAFGACYYEAMGERGLFFPDDWKRHLLFPDYPADFPVLAIFGFLGRIPKAARVLPATGGEPLRFSTLAFSMGKQRWLMVANHTDRTYPVKLENGAGLAYVKYLDADRPFDADWLAAFWAGDPGHLHVRDGCATLALSPFGIALVASDSASLGEPLFG